ncbi:MAG: VOC family protein [Gaiellales bacterium]
MRLDGIHHITCITASAPANLDFYVSVMGLRFVKKTVNFDVPDAYHLYFGDENGTPGSILTFFEYPRVSPGRAGAGMIHRLAWRVRDEAALDYWTQRLGDAGTEVERGDQWLAFDDPEGLGLSLVVDRSPDPPLAAASDVSEEHRVLGFSGVRAYSRDPDASEEILLKTMGFESRGEGMYFLQGPSRSAGYRLDPAPAQEGIQGAGTVHHIAWACDPSDQPAWRAQVADSGFRVTEIIDRKYFRSIYFNEPSGVLFEIATKGPGFTVDEDIEQLGNSLSLPEWHEDKRASLEKRLTPITNPRSR